MSACGEVGVAGQGAVADDDDALVDVMWPLAVWRRSASWKVVPDSAIYSARLAFLPIDACRQNRSRLVLDVLAGCLA